MLVRDSRTRQIVRPAQVSRMRNFALAGRGCSRASAALEAKGVDRDDYRPRSDDDGGGNHRKKRHRK